MKSRKKLEDDMEVRPMRNMVRGIMCIVCGGGVSTVCIDIIRRFDSIVTRVICVPIAWVALVILMVGVLICAVTGVAVAERKDDDK